MLSSHASSLVPQTREEGRVDAAPLVDEAASLDALPYEAAALEHALGGCVSDPHDRLDSVDAVREQPVEERHDGARSYAAAAGPLEQPVADLDRRAGGVELPERRATQELAGVAVDDCVGNELAVRAPLRQLLVEDGMELLFAEWRQACFAAEHRISERGGEDRHVVVNRSQDDVVDRELVRERGDDGLIGGGP